MNDFNNLNINDVQNYVLPNIAKLLSTEKTPKVDKSQTTDSQTMINSIFEKISASEVSDQDLKNFESLMDKTIKVIKENPNSTLSLEKINAALKQLKQIEKFDTNLQDTLNITIDNRLSSIFQKTADQLNEIQSKLQTTGSPTQSRSSTPTAPSPTTLRSSSSKTFAYDGSVTETSESAVSPISRIFRQVKSTFFSVSLEDVKQFLGPNHPLTSESEKALNKILENKEINNQFKTFLEDCDEARKRNKKILDRDLSPEISDAHNAKVKEDRTNLILAVAALDQTLKPSGRIVLSLLAEVIDSTGFITNIQINTDSLQYGLIKDIDHEKIAFPALERHLAGLLKYSLLSSEGFQPRYDENSLLFQRASWMEIKRDDSQQLIEGRRLFQLTFPTIHDIKGREDISINHDRIFSFEASINFEELFSKRTFDEESTKKLINLLTILCGITYPQRNTYTEEQFSKIARMVHSDSFQTIQKDVIESEKKKEELRLQMSKVPKDSDEYRKLDDLFDAVDSELIVKKSKREGFLKESNIESDTLFEAILDLDRIFDHNIDQVIGFGKTTLDFQQTIRRELNIQLLKMSDKNL